MTLTAIISSSSAVQASVSGPMVPEAGSQDGQADVEVVDRGEEEWWHRRAG